MQNIFRLIGCLVFCALPMIGNGSTSELRAGWFYPFSSDVREIYKKGGFSYEAEDTISICGGVSLWMNAGSFKKDGRTLNFHEKTTIQIYPLSAGFKYTLPLTSCVGIYLGIGSSYTTMKVRNLSPFLKDHIRKYPWGYVVKSGIIYYFAGSFFIDLYADYYSSKCSIEGRSFDIGGLRAGLGLGLGY